MFLRHFEDHNSIFEGNAAMISYGGGLEILSTEEAYFYDTQFLKNCADYSSGGIEMNESNLKFQNCLFEGNSTNKIMN